MGEGLKRAFAAAKATRVALQPTEHEEQVALFAWASQRHKQYPELVMMFAIPNSGDRHVSYKVKMCDEGLKRGVPDIFLPVARLRFHGLFIEMKRRKEGRVKPEQWGWLDELTANGYLAVVCRGCDAAIKVIEDYLR